MTRSLDQVEPVVHSATPSPRVNRLSGEVVYLYAFDIAYELPRLPVPELLGQPIGQFVVDASKRAPRQLSFYRPQMIRLPPLERLGPGGRVWIDRTVKFLPVGAISITVRVPFQAGRVEDLVAYHDLRFSDGTYLYDEVRQLAEDVRRALEPYAIRPVKQLGDEEAYTVFCIHAPIVAPGGDGEGEAPAEPSSEPSSLMETQRRGSAGASPSRTPSSTISTESWMHTRRREIASLLTEEPDPQHLSEQEADESTAKHFSYYDKDVVVIDWDAALIVDEPKYVDEILYIMELANLQLAELEAYDRILDDAVLRSYQDLRTRRVRSWASAGVQRELREIRVDLARLSDELSNITKFFGDWHLARIYKGLSDRFHLGDWHRTIDEKLKTLDDLYQILRADQNNRWMLILEATIVLLFIVDLLAIFVWKK
ncbi:MAG: hypothetical protein WBD40_04525 [Tepidisphaeraceae bacterium]